MRYRAIYDGNGLKAEIEDDQVIFWREDIEAPRSDLPTPRIMRDIEPYRNMIDGKMVTSRSEHRELLARNNCVEIGNEDPTRGFAKPKPSTTRREQLHKRLADVSDKQADKLLKSLKRGA